MENRRWQFAAESVLWPELTLAVRVGVGAS